MRRLARLDGKALADAAGIHPATVAIVEHGQRDNPPLRLVAALAKALRVSVVALTDPFVLRFGRVADDIHPAAINPPLPTNVISIDAHGLTGSEGMGRMLRALRNDRGLSIARLASLSGLSDNHIGFVERAVSRNPGLLNLYRHVRVLPDDEQLLSVAECVALAAQVFAEELTAFEAIRRYRARHRPSSQLGSSGVVITACR